MRVIAPLIALAAVIASPAPAPARADRWVRPVPGEIARVFDYAPAAPFAAGAHRGIDLTARPGARVRAACAGRVLHAGPVAGTAPVVSVRCGDRRVSQGPLAAISVRAGATVRAGETVGTLARGHRGLHLGVRRDGDPFAYEDPAALLPEAAPTLPASPRAPAPRGPAAPHAPTLPARPRPLRIPSLPDRQALAPRSGPAPAQPAQRSAAAPWPVWAGLALALIGTVGSGAAVRRRRRSGRRHVQAAGAAA